MANYTTLRTNLNDVLSNMPLTPLQAAQYDLTLQRADSGAPYVFFTYLPRGGVASTAQPNYGYGTMAMWNLVHPHQSIWVGYMINPSIQYEFSRGSVVSSLRIGLMHLLNSNVLAHQLLEPTSFSRNRSQIHDIRVG